jgi:hypothetical protein
LWVAEAYNYPNHGTRPGDRIVILEDSDHDGRADKRTVFYDKLNYVTGIEVGFGGAWVMSPPYFYFIADRDGNDVPDGKPQVLLDGFGNHANAGEGFVCNCVDPHLFHVIQGAHYEPWRNRESSQYAYERIPSIADHLHFVGTGNVRDGLGTTAEDQAGGGHAHCGTMVYLGDNWPERYRNTVFMNNIHGRRINNDLLRRAGSGYTAPHLPDVMRSRDPWFMGVTIQYGPDGAVFVSDWSDTGECHSTKNTRRHTGRIYKIAYGTPAARKTDL